MDMSFLISLALIYGLWFVGCFIAAVLHEAGHLLCARIASIKIVQVVIGDGPVLADWRIGGLALELRRWPVTGYVQPARDAVMPGRGLLALYLLGGVLGNITMIGLIMWLHMTGSLPKILGDEGMPFILVVTQASFIVGSLIPYRRTINGIPFASDGLQLLGLMWHRIDGLALLSPYRTGERLRLLSSKAFVRIAGQLSRPGRLSDPDVRREAWEALRRELALGGLPPDEEMLVLDSLITDSLIYDDPVLRSERDTWSARALQLGPKVRTLRGSRGAVLVETGRYEEGKAMLEPLVLAKETVAYDAALNRIFLARAEHALGDEAAARRLMAEAREMATMAGGGTVDALIERVGEEMQAALTEASLSSQNAQSSSPIAI